MKTVLLVSLLSAFLVGGCSATASSVKPAGPTRMQPLQASFAIDPAAERGTWVLRVVRELDGYKAEGVVLLSSDITPPPDTPHAVLAGSRAFLLLGQQRRQAGDLPRAIAAAKAGLAELGRSYAKPTSIEHTSMRILLAEEHAANGELDDAATELLDALGARIRMYVRKHAAFVRLPPEEELQRGN